MGFGKKLLVGGLALIGLAVVWTEVSNRVFAEREREIAEHWILENAEIYENEFAPKEMVDAVRAEYMTEEEGDEKGLSLEERGSYNLRETDASERLAEWTRANHHSGMDVNDENIMMFVDRWSDSVIVRIQTKRSEGESPQNMVTYYYMYSEYRSGVEKSLGYFRRPHVMYHLININSAFVHVKTTRMDISAYREYMHETEHQPSARSFQGLLDYNEERNPAITPESGE